MLGTTHEHTVDSSLVNQSNPDITFSVMRPATTTADQQETTANTSIPLLEESKGDDSFKQQSLSSGAKTAALTTSTDFKEVASHLH